MKKLFEATTTGSTTPGGYNKPVEKGTLVRRTPEKTTTGCVCKTLPGKVICGICNPKTRR